MKLICYTLDGKEVDVKPASSERRWMNETRVQFAKRCLPLVVANSNGWQINALDGCWIKWNGGIYAKDLKIKTDTGTADHIASHFGHGILTFKVHCLFRTEPGINLWVSGPTNQFKDGIQAMNGLLETDWMPYTFTMNWQVTRKRKWIRFEKGEPIAQVFPVPRGMVDNSDPGPAGGDAANNHRAGKEIKRSRLIVGLVSLVLGVAGLLSGEFSLMALGTMIFLLALGLLGPMLISPITAFFSRALVLIFGQEGRMAASNIARQPRRASITASSLMVSLAILIGLGGMLASTYGGTLRFLDASMRSDYIMMPSLVVTNDTVGAGPNLAEMVKRIPGVAELTTLRQIDTVDADGIGIRLIGIDPLDSPRIAGLYFIEGDESAYTRMNNGATVIINGRYATQFGVGVGDKISLEGDHGPIPVVVAGIGLDYINVKLPSGIWNRHPHPGIWRP